jgi:hypothetical protein
MSNICRCGTNINVALYGQIVDNQKSWKFLITIQKEELFTRYFIKSVDIKKKCDDLLLIEFQ